MRNQGLDLLRFVAVFLVLGRHLHLTPDQSLPLLETWKLGGWIGVDLFFVLSGFLVSSLLFKEHIRTGKVDVGRFLIRRAFKIYPAFWCMLTFTLTIKNIQGDPPSNQALLGELLFLQNYLGGIWPHTWSLAVEEHFYLGIAALFVAAIAWNRNQDFTWIPLAFLIVALTCLALRISTNAQHTEFHHNTLVGATHLRVDSLFFGVLLSYWFHYKNLEARTASIPSWALCSAGLMLMAPAFYFSHETYAAMRVVGFIALYLGSGAILLAAIRIRKTENLVLQVLATLGAASYSIYLWHLPVGEWGFTFLARVTGLDNFAFYLMNYFIGSFLIGWLFSHAIEFPTLRLRNFLFPTEKIVGAAVACEANLNPAPVVAPIAEAKAGSLGDSSVL